MQYKVKIRLLIAGPLGGELAAELPFTLTHAKPTNEGFPVPNNTYPSSYSSAIIAKPQYILKNLTTSNGNNDNELNTTSVEKQLSLDDDEDLIKFDSYVFILNFLIFV